MKKSLLLILLVIFSVFVFSACEAVKLTTEQQIEEAFCALELDRVIVDSIQLPNLGLYDTSIFWESNDPDIIDDNGYVVNVPLYDTEVSFGVNVILGGISKDYTVGFLVSGRDKSYFEGVASSDSFFEYEGSTIFQHEDFITTFNGGYTDYARYNWECIDRITYGVEIYLLPSNFQDGDYFVWSFGLTDFEEDYLSEAFIFFAMDNGELKVGTQLPVDSLNVPILDAAAHQYATSHESAVEITEAGWYTIVCTFILDNDDVFVEWNLVYEGVEVVYSAIDQQVYDPNGTEEYEYLPASEVSGSRYAWICRFSDGLLLDIRRIWLGK